ncbi:MAG: HEPN domain-containing protein [Anaerolineales bacterium]|nr:HEPN domain-containing protein [Anaerolineales bacterium]
MDSPAEMNSPATWLELAESKLDDARRIFEIGLYNDAVSRAYYAMFYAAKAALLSEGLDLRRHSSAVTKFRELFVITGRVDAEYLRYLGRAQSARERSDYAPFATLNKEGAEEIFNAASAFIGKIKELLK